MKRLLTLFLTLSMMVTGFMSVAAQDSASTFASGLNTPAAYIDERGDTIATVQVTEIESEWTDYDKYSAPKNGVVYRAVHFTVTNATDKAIIIEPYDFTLVDEFGRNNGRSYVSVAEGSEGTIFEDDLPLSGNESAELVLVFEMYDDVNPSLFAWQPDSGKLVVIDLQTERTEDVAYAVGFDAPATWTDDRGRAIASVEVTGVELDWADYDKYYDPEVGTTYVAVSFTLTNLSNKAIIAEAYDFSLIDSEGTNSGRSWASASEESGVVLFEEDTPIAAGESYEGVMVFSIIDSLTPVALVWQPDSGLLNMVNISEGGSDAPASSPVAGESKPDTAVAEPATPEAESKTETAKAEPASSSAKPASSSATSSSTEGLSELTSEPVAIHDVTGKETGTAQVISMYQPWEGYIDDDAPRTGQHYLLLTVEVQMTDGTQQVSLLDFTVVLDDGNAVSGDMLINAKDAEVKVSKQSETLDAGQSVQLTIPFLVEDGQTPVEVHWNTGQEHVVLPIGEPID